MVESRKLGEKLIDAIIVLLMIVIIVITLYPMTYVLFASLSDGTRIMKHTGILLAPLGFDLSAYQAVFRNPMILLGYRNTTFLIVFGSIYSVFMTALGAYFLSRKNVLWKKPIMFLIVFTMFFSGGLIPFFFVVRDLNLLDNLLSLIIPSSIATFNMIIMRTAFMSIPDSFEESARIDGANDFSILFRVILPLSMPVVAVMLLFYGVGRWNAWFQAAIFLRTRELFPLQLVLREILIANDLGVMTAGSDAADRMMLAATIPYALIIVATVPVLFIYPFLQRYFIKGVMVGGLKG